MKITARDWLAIAVLIGATSSPSLAQRPAAGGLSGGAAGRRLSPQPPAPRLRIPCRERAGDLARAARPGRQRGSRAVGRSPHSRRDRPPRRHLQRLRRVERVPPLAGDRRPTDEGLAGAVRAARRQRPMARAERRGLRPPGAGPDRALVALRQARPAADRRRAGRGEGAHGPARLAARRRAGTAEHLVGLPAEPQLDRQGLHHRPRLRRRIRSRPGRPGRAAQHRRRRPRRRRRRPDDRGRSAGRRFGDGRADRPRRGPRPLGRHERQLPARVPHPAASGTRTFSTPGRASPPGRSSARPSSPSGPPTPMRWPPRSTCSRSRTACAWPRRSRASSACSSPPTARSAGAPAGPATSDRRRALAAPATPGARPGREGRPGRLVGRHVRAARELRDQPARRGTRGATGGPYVAVWVEDKDGLAARTLALWLMARQPGPRWHPDLKRWYRDDQVRRLADDTNLIDDDLARRPARRGNTPSPGTARTTTASRSGPAPTRSTSRPRASTGRTRSSARKSPSPTSRSPRTSKAMSRSSPPRSSIAERARGEDSPSGRHAVASRGHSAAGSPSAPAPSCAGSISTCPCSAWRPSCSSA